MAHEVRAEWQGVEGWNEKLEAAYQHARERVTLKEFIDSTWDAEPVFTFMVVESLHRVKRAGLSLRQAVRRVVREWRRAWRLGSRDDPSLPSEQSLPGEEDVGPMAYHLEKAPDVEWAMGEVTARFKKVGARPGAR